MRRSCPLKKSIPCVERNMQQMQPQKPAMTFDEVSMERSKNFVMALQELKNLRPQLYSAADYCEKSYLHNEQKQMVIDNLKDYTVRAVVNAIDHLGTVAYKLTDLYEQQTLDVSIVDLKITCLNQQLLTCQAYVEKEGLQQQTLSTATPRHHKHYILPNSVNRKMQINLLQETGSSQKTVQTKPRILPSGTPTSKTLSWHLASETKSSMDGVHSSGNMSPKAPGMSSQVFQLIDSSEVPSAVSLTQLHSSSGFSAASPLLNAPAAARKDLPEASRSLLAFRSFDQPRQREISRSPARSKSMLSSFFAKHKSAKLKMGSAS